MKNFKIFLYILFSVCITNVNVAICAEDDYEESEEEFDDFDDFDFDDEDEAERKKKEEEERKRREEEEKRLREEELRKRERALQLKARKEYEQQQRELNAFIEAAPDTTEYTLDPGSVELVVELDPNHYGFRERNHRNTFGLEFDYIFQGRTAIKYDFRFFEYLSFGLNAGFDMTAISLVDKIKKQMSKPSPEQLYVYGGLFAKWRLTEWYMRSSFFIEPGASVGYMWQDLASVETTHWRVRPGLYGGIETVFNSGLSFQVKIGGEMPFDFGSENPYKENISPSILFALGLAI